MVEGVYKMNCLINSILGAAYEIRFQSLFNEGRAMSFPCDAQGTVLLDSLTERARNNYLYARAVVGREYAYPSVRQNVTL